MVLWLEHLVVGDGALGAACNGGAMVVLWLEPLLVLLVWLLQLISRSMLVNTIEGNKFRGFE